MPPLPDFDFYEELELTAAATADEITASFRRLALIHHPDKNENSEESTAKFQRIQTAYETLKDVYTRREYDERPAAGDEDEYSDYEDSDDSEVWAHIIYDGGFNEEHVRHIRFAIDNRGRVRVRFESPTPSEEENKEQEAVREALREAREKEEKLREEKKREQQKREEEKRKEEEAAAKAKEERLKEEKIRQEKIWEEFGATTTSLKQKSCDHTDVWPKEQSKKKGEKIKCESCAKRRGTIGFKCPHCDMVACQVCLNKFAINRTKAGLSAKSKSWISS